MPALFLRLLGDRFGWRPPVEEGPQSLRLGLPLLDANPFLLCDGLMELLDNGVEAGTERWLGARSWRQRFTCFGRNGASPVCSL